MACFFHWVRIVAIVMFPALLWINSRTEGFSGISVVCSHTPYIFLFPSIKQVCSKIFQHCTIMQRKKHKHSIQRSWVRIRPLMGKFISVKRVELHLLNQSPELGPSSPINTSPKAGMNWSCRTGCIFCWGSRCSSIHKSVGFFSWFKVHSLVHGDPVGTWHTATA